MKELKMYDALKRITKYQTPDQLRRNADEDFGLGYEEVLEMAYENIIGEAENAIRGMRRPKAEAPLKSKKSVSASSTAISTEEGKK